ncbi:MAG TPA: hypothetical protein VHP14_01985 [Anaerolineales bacterium]|nr:hypothetical protein [Anaerolineales bacterium]
MSNEEKGTGMPPQSGSGDSKPQHVTKVSGNSINITGNVSVKGDIVGGNKIVNNSIVVNQAFETIRQIVNKLPDPDDKQEALEIVRKLEMEAQKGEAADEKKVERWFNFLAGMSGDIWDVMISTFANPILGIGTIFQKVAARAKENAKT